MCIDSRQSTGCLGKFGELLLDCPETIEEFLTAFLHSEPRSESNRKHNVTQLPLLVLDMICTFLADDLDALTRFAELSEDYHEVVCRAASRLLLWKGKRIICVGDYARDYPQGFLKPKEEVEFGDKSLYDYSEKFDSLFTRWDGRLSKWLKQLGLEAKCRVINERSILHNMTSKEYVRAGSIPQGSKLRLGQIVLIQICWSTDPSMSMDCDDSVCRGPWAGHRLEINTKEPDESWSDVSEVLIKKGEKLLLA